MRIDKFLKVSRIIKRRTLAKEITDQGRIMVNGKVAKASTTIKEGDYINIKFGQKELTVKVNRIVETSKKEDAINLYEVVEGEG
ncbi:MAG: RNA-binding S4 domain-containing protein [Vulcanibacillus sp.]